VLSAHLLEEPPAPALPEAVGEALRKEAEHRPPTATAFIRRLRHAIERTEAVRWRRAELPRRAALAAGIAAAALAAVLLFFPAGDLSVEHRLDDLRIETATARPPDPRILLVSVDESSLRESTMTLAARADEVGKALSAIFAAGARGVAVDFILPPQWKDSIDFTDAVLRHPESLTLAASSKPDGSVDGLDCVSGLTQAALGRERTAALFGFVNLDKDADDVTRTGRLTFRDDTGGEHQSWAARAASVFGAVPRLPPGEAFRIDYRVDGHLYARIPWRDLPATLAHHPERIRGRLVLVGGDFLNAGDDGHQVPVSLGKIGAVSGLTLQALQVDTIAAGLPVRGAPRIPFLLLATLGTAWAALTVFLGHHAGRAVSAVLGAGALYAAVSLPVFRQTGLLLPITAPSLVAVIGLAAALILRRRLTPIPSLGSFPA